VAISLDVVTRLNDRSARDAAQDAQRYFDNAGKNAGVNFDRNMTAGFDKSAKTAEKASATMSRAFDKAADAARRVRVEQEKYNSLVAKGNVDQVKLVQTTERLATARRNEATAVRQAASAHSEYSTHLRTLGNAFETAESSATGFMGSIAELGQGIGGIEPALLSVSVHNMLRSGSLGIETVLAPAAALGELNRLVRMSEQGDHYFTIWYGVYQASTRTLRYASAGAPPGLAFEAGTGGPVSVTELSTPATPVGMFADTVFTSGSYVVLPGCRILIYSDGAHEITLANDQQMTWHAFKDVATQLAESSNWSLDALVDQLKALTPTGAFEDDCSLIELTFD
jgi:serine phosphatase RsbU (regulator of sigma subunit)